MSGDLKDPGASIPKGTVAAGIGTFIIYGVLVLVFAFTTTNAALYENYFVMMFVCVAGKPIVATGIFAAVTSSALAALVGAGRVIQAIARDDLFPILRIFARGSKKGDEPIYGLLLTWVLCQLVLLIGELNVIAPFVTMFFLLSFLATNFACFFLRVTGAPNFRPSFKYFHWSTALVGALSSAVIMFVVDTIKVRCGSCWLVFFFCLKKSSCVCVCVCVFDRW
jgi:solute carrier family 12 (potassium/chloride transporters), member 9